MLRKKSLLEPFFWHKKPKFHIKIRHKSYFVSGGTIRHKRKLFLNQSQTSIILNSKALIKFFLVPRIERVIYLIVFNKLQKLTIRIFFPSGLKYLV